MRLSTTSLARACSRHAWLTLAAWGVVLVGSVAALALVLTGFTTEAAGTNDPEYLQAEDRLLAAFPSDPERAVSDLVVVRSERLTVDDDVFRSFVAELAAEGRQTGAVLGGRSYYDTDDRSLVSADGHATLIPAQRRGRRGGGRRDRRRPAR